MKMKMNTRKKYILLWSAAMSLMWLAACGDDDSGYFPTISDYDRCRPTVQEPVSLPAGDWVVTGWGTRRHCSGQLAGNGDISMTSAPLPVDQSGGELTAAAGDFSLCGGQADCRWDWNSPVAGVDGECIHFKTTEHDRGATITMEFDGRYTDGRIMGVFVSNYEGADSCEIRDGVFTVEIQ